MRRALGCLLLLACLSLHAQERVSPAAMRQATATGTARVMVMLRDPATSLPLATAGAVRARRQAVAADTGRVLRMLAPSRFRVARRFVLVPAIVLEVDQAGLRRLAAMPGVSKVDLDAGGGIDSVAPDESSVLNRVDLLPEMGLTGAGEEIAVIDTGIDTDHADFAGRIVDQACFCSATGGSGGCCPNAQATQFGAGAAEDAHGHGTNVAGIMAGAGHVAPRGVAPLARIVAVRVLDASGRFCCSSDIVAAMDWIATNHAEVSAVNLSLGSDQAFSGNCDASTAWTQALAMALDNLVQLGAVVSVSSGNDGNLNGMQAPACVKAALSVAATWDAYGGSTLFLGCTDASTAPMQPTCFSNRGSATDVFAAGAFVTSTGKNGATSTYGGTSQAAPMAGACAALLHEAAPAATVQQRMDAIVLSPARINDAASGRQYPFLDCEDAARLLDPAALQPIVKHDSPPIVPRLPATLRSGDPQPPQARTIPRAARADR